MGEVRYTGNFSEAPTMFAKGWTASGPALVAYIGLAKLLLHFATNGQYGYHGDELYFMACGEHLDWGYVDHAPLIAFVAKVGRLLLGDSLFAIRFFPAVAGALTVVLTGLIVRALGGGRFAQCLAALTVVIAPVYLRTGNILAIPSFEPLFWTLGSYLVILIVKQGRPKLWLLVGLVAGLGILNKHSMLLWGFGLVVGLLLSSERKQLLKGWIWLGGLVAVAVVAPNLIWQMQHDWLTLQFIRNLNEHVMTRITPLEFAAGQIIYLHPVNAPIWLAGLAYLLLGNRARPYRFLGWSYVSLFVLLNVIKSKIYYLSPAYPVLLAAGHVDSMPSLWRLPSRASLQRMPRATAASALRRQDGSQRPKNEASKDQTCKEKARLGVSQVIRLAGFNLPGDTGGTTSSL